MSESLLGGYAGKILRVDLTQRRIAVERPEERFYRQYLGGSGFIAYYLYKELPSGADPLGPENKLIFALGPLVGTSAVGSSRNAVGALSPLSGGIALSQAGEFWGVELKRAGYDAIVIEGKADRPVYLMIRDDQVEIRDAAHLWGKTTKETQLALRSELGDERVRVAMIGPAGENLVRYACVLHGLHDVAGRGGLGAVMGSKNLKAVAVRGTGSARVANPELLDEVNREIRSRLYDYWLTQECHEYGTGGPMMEVFESIGNLPVRNWRDGRFPGVKKIHGGVIKETVRVGMQGCYACPVRCKKQVKMDQPYRVDPDYGGPEYETLASLGSNCGIDDLAAILKANERCNALGLDTISTGGTIAFAMESFEKGLLGPDRTDGLDLRFGNAEAMLQCIELIAQRKGLGDLLAEGTARVALALGGEALNFAMHVKGVEPGQHEPRLQPGLGLGFMVNPHGADHCANLHDGAYASEEGIKRLHPFGFLEPLPVEEVSPRKVAVFRLHHLKEIMADCLMMCHLINVAAGYDTLARLLAAVTGWDTGVMELIRIGERVLTAARMVNLRQGLTAADDRLPPRYFTPKTDGPLSTRALDPEKMEQAKRYYYLLMGWTEEGVPRSEKLAELGLES